jgi:ABC-type multidrug transport system ATPase subunit
MHTDLALVTEGLTKRYRDTTAVAQLDLAIPYGTIFGFLGPNGAGKTTTIRMLLGLVAPTSGRAWVLGLDIQRDRRAIAPQVGAIVEAPAFYGYLSGADNLELLGRSSNQAIPKHRITTLLERVGLGERAGDPLQTYSLGMRQRLGIAATLLAEPRMIFLDEPTNGLDPAGTVEVRRLIKQLGAEGYTIFLSSHILSEVEQVCDEVAIIQRGTTRIQGPIRQLLAHGEQFRLWVAPLDRALALLQAYPELHARAPDAQSLQLSVAAADVPQLVRRLVEADIDVYEVRRHQLTLEELFLDLTGRPSEPPAMLQEVTS